MRINDRTLDERRVAISFERHNLLDCDAVRVPCVVADQCRDNCISGALMRCDEGGFCGRGIQYSPQEWEECDVSRGMIMVFNALDGLAVESLCVSMYRDIIDDDGELRPYVCENGRMSMNLEVGPFAVEDCECDRGYTRFAYGSGAFSRSIPVCLPDNVAVLYRRIY